MIELDGEINPRPAMTEVENGAEREQGDKKSTYEEPNALIIM
jgi:hypothetical protein